MTKQYFLERIHNINWGILLLAVSYAVGISMATSVNAVEEPMSDDVEIEEIVVYGTKDKVRKALAAKRNADSVIEALSLEDIGKLPDVSIAESLSRLPGLSSERNPAGASFISIRGMGAILSNATLNGREVTTSEQTRSIDYSQFPTELIVSAWVYKTPTASLIEGGVAGTIELKTARPLDYDQRTISVTARARYNDLASDLPNSDAVGYRGSVSYIDQFNDGALGIVLGYAHQDNPLVSADSSIGNSRTVNAGGGLIAGMPSGFGPNNGFNIPFGAGNSITMGNSIRNGYLAAIQWRPNGNLELNIDATYSRFDIETSERALQVSGYGSFGNDFTDVVVDGFNLLSATATCNRPVNECTSGFGQNLRAINAHYEEVNDLFNGGISATWADDQWAFSTDLAYSAASLDNFYGAVSTKPFDLSGTTPEEINPVSVFGVHSSGAAFLTSPNDFADPTSNLITGYNIPTDNEVMDDLYSFNVDVEKFLDNRLFTSVKTGIRYLDRSKAIRIRKDDTSSFTPVVIPTGLINGVIDQDVIDADFLTNPILALDVQGVVNRFFPQSSTQVCMTCSSDISEKTLAGYFQANFETSLGNIPVSGNIGVRIAETEVNTAGFQNTSRITGVPGLTPTRTSNKDTYVLPSLNIAILPTDDTVIRLALARTIARPPINFYNPGFSQFQARGVGAPVTAFDAGNPFLDPYESNQVDLTFEKYFSEDVALTLSLFYKNLDAFITNVRMPAPRVVLTDGSVVDGFVVQPVNGNGGYIRGAEILWQQAFTALPAPFNRSGIYANYSYTESNISFSEAFSSGEYGLDGLSKHVGNLTLWYSRGQFDARVSYYFRSEFTRPQRAGQAYITNDDGGDLSFRIAYTFNGLVIAFQGYNLTNNARDSFYGGNPAQRGQYRKFGKNYELAVAYKF